MDRYAFEVATLVRGSATVVVEAESESAAGEELYRRLGSEDTTCSIGDHRVRVPPKDLMIDTLLHGVNAVRRLPDADASESIYLCDFDVEFPGSSDDAPDPEGYAEDYVAEALREHTQKFDPASALADWRWAPDLYGENLLPTRPRGASSVYQANLHFFVRGSSPAEALERITKLLRVEMQDDTGRPLFRGTSPRDVPRLASADETASLEIPENDNPAPAPRRRARP